MRAQLMRCRWFDMEPETRGMIERFLKWSLEEDNLRVRFVIFEGLKEKKIIDSIESAMIAHVYTSIFDLLIALESAKGTTRGVMSEVDVNEFHEFFMSWALHIKSKVREICYL